MSTRTPPTLRRAPVGYEGQTLWATKRWGCGRLRQAARRWLCKRRGHEATTWRWDGEGAYTRRCIHGCGMVQVSLYKR
jgi:hypothetical protein